MRRWINLNKWRICRKVAVLLFFVWAFPPGTFMILFLHDLCVVAFSLYPFDRNKI